MSRIEMAKKGIDHSILTNHDNKYIQFYGYLVELKNLYRQGWTRRWGFAPEKTESVAEHIFSVAMMFLLYAKEEDLRIDVHRVVLMILVHDFSEVIVGDVMPGDGLTHKEKKAQERSAIQKLFDGFRSKEFFCELWEEYAAHETEESIYAHDIDKLDVIMMAVAYSANGLSDSARKEFCGDIVKVQTEGLRRIITDVSNI